MDLALQNIILSKQPFKTQPRIENGDDVTWSPQHNMPIARTNKWRALSLQEVELDGWFLILHIVLKTCTIWFMHKFNISFSLFHFYTHGSTFWIWTNPSTDEALKFETPLKWKFIWGPQSWTLPGACNFISILLLHSQHLLVQATCERFLPTWDTFRAILATESHRLQPVLVLSVHWWPAPTGVGSVYINLEKI